MKESVLITGGAGFIGSNIAEKLLEEKYNIIIVDNLSTGKKENIEKLDLVFINGDIMDSKSLNDIFTNYKIDYVIHLAAQVSVNNSMKLPQFDAEQNIIGTLNVLEAAVKYQVKKILFASSAAVYGNPEYLPIDEHHQVNPLSFYGLSKYTAEKYIKLYSEMYGLEYIIFRYANVYGMRQDQMGEAGVIAIFCKNALENMAIEVHGDGKQTRDFIFVKDIAEANFRAIKSNIKNEIINIGTGEKNSIIDLYQILEEVLDKDIECTKTSERKGDIRDSYLSVSKSEKLLGFKASYQLEEGIREYLEHCMLGGKK